MEGSWDLSLILLTVSTPARTTFNRNRVVSILFHTASATTKHTIDIVVSRVMDTNAIVIHVIL